MGRAVPRQGTRCPFTFARCHTFTIDVLLCMASCSPPDDSRGSAENNFEWESHVESGVITHCPCLVHHTE